MILGFFQFAPVIYAIVVNTMLAIGVSYLASLMMKKPKQFSPDIGNYPQQTAMKGLPIQKVYGTRRVAGNILWMKDLGEIDIGGGIMVKRKSYLIGICEGPAVVLKYWLGPTLQAGGRKFYFFDGDGTTGYWFKGGRRVDMGVTVRDLTGEEFGDYEKTTCCCFVSDHLCNMDGSPPEFTFEVRAQRPVRKYFVGFQNGTATTKIITYASIEASVDTTWGSSGYWNGYQASGMAYDAFRLEDGRILLAYTYYTLTMIKPDGTTDTTWGTNGSYTFPNSAQPRKILQDNDGNFHVFGGVSDDYYTYVKLDSNGTFLTGLTGTYTKLRIFYDAIWVDEAKTRIIAVGGYSTVRDYGPPDTGYYSVNTMAIDPETGTRDATWAGNVGFAGFGNYGVACSLYHMVRTDDGDFVVMRNAANTLSKVKADGTALDTTWATNGELSIGTITINPEIPKLAESNGQIYVLTYNVGPYNTISRVDSRGIVRDSVNISAVAGIYHCLSVIGSKVILGTTGESGATHDVEIWTKDFVYRTGFDIPDASYIFFILPDMYDMEAADENPAIIVRDLATDTRYGAKLNDTYLDNTTFASVENFCWDNDYLISLVCKDAKPLVDYIDQILAHCNGYRSWSGGKLKLGVFKDEDAVDPPITQNDLVVEGDEEPVTVAPRKRSETFNRIRVGWSNRANDYDFSSEIAEDQVDQRIGDEVRIREVDLSGICRIELARKIAQRGLFESMYRYNFYTFRVGYRHSLMEVGDVKLLSDGGQIINQKIRILSIKEEKDGRVLAVEAIEEAAGLYLSTTYDSQTAWTPSALYPTDEVELSDAATVTVTPIGSVPAESIVLSDYAHSETI